MKVFAVMVLVLLLSACKNEESRTSSKVQCGSKTYCSEMTSCAEARTFLYDCGLERLDRDGDGVPCEKLCR